MYRLPAIQCNVPWWWMTNQWSSPPRVPVIGTDVYSVTGLWCQWITDVTKRGGNKHKYYSKLRSIKKSISRQCQYSTACIRKCIWLCFVLSSLYIKFIYKTTTLLRNTHKRHSKSRPKGRGMKRPLWFRCLTSILHFSFSHYFGT